VSVITGKELKSLDLKFEIKFSGAGKLFLGQNRYFAIAGYSGPGNKSYLWLFKATLDAEQLTPHATIPIDQFYSFSGPNVNFSANEDQLLIDRKGGYAVHDVATGALLNKYENLQEERAIAISPDGSRVLSLDSDGLVLRDLSSSIRLPKLTMLPWGRWGTGKDDTFVINRDWTRCVGLGSRVGDDGKTVRAIHSWQVDDPLIDRN
jgi:hypothetical protein